jgi:plasmid stability protein
MGQILVRNLDDSVIERLKARASRADTSLEQTVRDILTEAARPSQEELWAEIDRLREGIRSRHGGDIAFDATAAIREDRDNDEPYR